MENIGIQTTQNVLIEHQIAGVGDRIVSQLLDYLFIGAYLFIFGIILFKLNIIDETFVVIIYLLPVFFYSLIFEIAFHGQSPAKMIMKIKVVKLDGSQPGLGNYIIRWIFRLVDISLMTGLVAVITIIANGKGQRLGDIAAGTTVVKLQAAIKIDDLIYRAVPQNYNQVFANILTLTDDDIHAITEVIQGYQRYRNSYYENLVREAKKAVENKIAEGKSFDVEPDKFLKMVLFDYNYANNLL